MFLKSQKCKYLKYSFYVIGRIEETPSFFIDPFMEYFLQAENHDGYTKNDFLKHFHRRSDTKKILDKTKQAHRKSLL